VVGAGVVVVVVVVVLVTEVWSVGGVVVGAFAGVPESKYQPPSATTITITMIPIVFLFMFLSRNE
jgi:hypothetical protein